MRRPDLVLACACTVAVAGAIGLWLGRAHAGPAGEATTAGAQVPNAENADRTAAAAPGTAATDAARTTMARSTAASRDAGSKRAVEARAETRRHWPVTWKATSATHSRAAATE